MDNGGEIDCPEKKAKYFCARTFREELRMSYALKSCKKFISAAQSDEDVILEYMESGGSMNEILSLIDKTAKGDLSTALPVFEIAQLILLRFQSPSSKYYQHCFDSAKRILLNHMISIQSMLTMNTDKHKKVALKLLTAIVTFHSSFANEVLNLFLSSPTLTNDLILPAPEKESVRKCFILFILSFLVEGSPTVLKMLIDSKGFLNLIIPGLKYDEASTVNVTLSMMEDKILKNVKISKTLKLKTFNTQVVKHLFDLYEWKGPQALKKYSLGKQKKHKAVEVNQEEKNLVVECVHSFLLVLCTSKKHGISFSDKSLGTTETSNNQLLLSVFESLSNPLSNKKMSELILKTLIMCPDLVKPTLLKLEPFFQPRNSQNWFEAIEFAENLIKDLDVVNLLKSDEESISSGQVSKVVKSLCTPAPLLRTAKAGAEKSQPMEVRMRSLSMLLTMWESSRESITAFFQIEPNLKKSINDFLFNFLPEFEEVIELWRDICKKEFLDTFSAKKRSSFLPVVLKSLQIIMECQTEGINSFPGLASLLLDHLDQTRGTIKENEFISIQAKIIQLVERDIPSLILDLDLFKTSLLISLRSPDESSLSCASKMLSSLEIFEGNKSEIDVWLLCLPPATERRCLIAEFLVDSVSKRFKTAGSFQSDDGSTKRFQTDAAENSGEWESEESPTPFALLCVATLENSISNPEEDSQKINSFRSYLCDVIIHLQHSHPNDEDFYGLFKPSRKALGKPVMEYLKHWTTNSLSHSDLEVISCPRERELASWLIDERDNRKFEEVFESESEISRIHLSFRMVVAHLVMKTASDDLSESDAAKFVGALNHFMKLDNATFQSRGEEGDRSVAEDLLKKDSIHFKKCIDFLLNRSLLKSFNVFIGDRKNGEYHCSRVMVKVLMGEESVKERVKKNPSIQNWKAKFLKELRKKFRKKKSIEGADDFERVLNFFEYRREEVEDLIKLLTDVSDFDIFLHEEKPSKWTSALAKFVKIHCTEEELDVEAVKKLCLLTKRFSENDCSDLEVLDDCFVYLLRRHPRHLLSIENDFLEVVLRRKKVNPSTVTLGKLLLNHPVKIQRFLQIGSQYVESKLVFPLLSAMLAKEEPLFETIKSQDEFLAAWKTSEITRENSPELFDLLENVYRRFEENIIRAMRGENEEIILKNISVARELVRLFSSKSIIKQIRKKVQKGNLQSELLLEAVKKFKGEAMTEICLKGLMIRFCQEIKNNSDVEEEIWIKHCSNVSELIELNKESGWESAVESSEWKELYKLGLGLCLRTCDHPSILKILRILITAFYGSGKELEISPFYFQMVISHSQFLNALLRNSPVKIELVELFHSLIRLSPGEMSSKHIPMLLASYTASLCPSDETILKILRFYEEKGFKFADFEPLVWGETAISHYSIGTTGGLSLWHRFSMTNVLHLLESQKLEISLREFPIHRSLEGDKTPRTDFSSSVYDPAFLLPLFVNLLSPGSVVFPLPFVYKGGLAYTIRALSSECKDIRAMASLVLARFYNHLELNQNLKQKLIWMHFINCFRYGIENISVRPVSNIVTLFFARMTMELCQQPAEMLQPLQNFLLAKSYFVLNVIPEFLPLFHSSQVCFRKHREWLLQVLKDGTRTNKDVEIIFYSMAFKVIFCFFQSQLCDVETKKLILQVIERLMTIRKSMLLISQYGLLNWMNSIDSISCPEILSDLLNLISGCVKAIVKDIKADSGKQAGFSDLVQILNISVKLLPIINSVKSIDSLNCFSKIIFDCLTTISAGEKKTDWISLNKGRIREIIQTGIDLLGRDLTKYTRISFYFGEHEEECEMEVIRNLKRAVFAFHLLAEK